MLNEGKSSFLLSPSVPSMFGADASPSRFLLPPPPPPSTEKKGHVIHQAMRLLHLLQVNGRASSRTASMPDSPEKSAGGHPVSCSAYTTQSFRAPKKAPWPHPLPTLECAGLSGSSEALQSCCCCYVKKPCTERHLSSAFHDNLIPILCLLENICITSPFSFRCWKYPIRCLLP